MRIADGLRRENGRTMKIKVMIKPCAECGGFTAWAPQLPGCFSQGETEEEAAANLREAALLWLEDCDEPEDCAGARVMEIEL